MNSSFTNFLPFCEICSCEVATVMDDGNAKFLSQGLVHFETEEAAQLAIDKVNDKLIAGKRVSVKLQQSDPHSNMISSFWRTWLDEEVQKHTAALEEYTPMD
jgi:RNA recognition motif-containing protein